jgi:hypothetical protein
MNALNASDAFHACLFRGDEILELRMKITGEDGVVLVVPCGVTRDHEQFNFMSGALPTGITAKQMMVIDQDNNEIVTYQDRNYISKGKTITLHFVVVPV